MKTFFYASPATDKFDTYIDKIYTEIEKLGYQHVHEEHKTHRIREILELGKVETKDYLKNIEEVLTNMAKADICIFEVSHQSLGAGYLIDKALDNSKPTIVLYYEGYTPHILTVVDNEKLVVKSYNESNYKRVLRKALDQAREKRDKRFNFFLSPKLLNYLEEVSTQQGVTKSKILRDLIVEHMRQNTKSTS